MKKTMKRTIEDGWIQSDCPACYADQSIKEITCWYGEAHCNECGSKFKISDVTKDTWTLQRIRGQFIFNGRKFVNDPRELNLFQRLLSGELFFGKLQTICIQAETVCGSYCVRTFDGARLCLQTESLTANAISKIGSIFRKDLTHNASPVLNCIKNIKLRATP